MDSSINDAKNVFSKYRNLGFRPFQKEAIEFAINSEKKIVVVEAATGSGKSLLGMTYGSACGGVSYLVHSKVLQNQITSDFPEAKSLFGRSNYTCARNPEATCDECLSTKESPCDMKHTACPYELRKGEVLQSRFKILNYDYFLSECNYVGRFSGQKFVVIDEADNLENTLVNFTTLTFSNYALQRLGMLDMANKLKMDSKYKNQLLESWIEFGNQSLYRVNSIIKKLSGEIAGIGDNVNDHYVRLAKERIRVVRLKEKIELFINNVDDDWILDNQEGKLIFRPLWMTPDLAEKYLWRHAGKFVLMSASFYPRNILAKCLGFDISDMDYFMVPSQFPVKNRPIYVSTVANLTAKTADIEIPKLIPAIMEIAASRPTSKGICHAVSYSLAHKIVDAMKDPRFITHNSNDRQETLDRFIASTEPLILVSPSLERGVSLDGDKCRMVIIAKAPYLNLGDKIISARLFKTKVIGNEWYKATMLLTVLQMAGRGVRSATDYAETFILDEQVKSAITSRPGFLPSWWLDALEFGLPEDIQFK